MVVAVASMMMFASFSTFALAEDVVSDEVVSEEVVEAEVLYDENGEVIVDETLDVETQEVAEVVAEIPKIILDDAIEQALANNSSVLEAQNDLAIAAVELERNESSVKSYNKLLGYPDLSQMNQDVYSLLVLAPAMYDISYKLAEETLTLTESAVKLSVISSYYTVIADGKNELALLDAYYRAETQYNAVMSKYELGMTTKLETLSAEVELNSARSDLYAARNQTIQDKRAFNVLIGNDYDMNWSPAEQLTFEEVVFEDQVAAAAELVENSSAPKLSYYAYEMALEQYNYDSYYYHEGTYNEQITTMTYENALISYENTLNETEANALANIENLENVAEQYKIALASEDLLREIYRLSVLLYDNGFNTQADVLSAAADLSAMESARLNALTGYNVLKTSIEYGIIQ